LEGLRIVRPVAIVSNVASQALSKR